MKLATQERLSTLNIKAGDSTLIFDMGYHRHVPLMVEEIDTDGTLWCIDQDGGGVQVTPDQYQNILSVQTF